MLYQYFLSFKVMSLGLTGTNSCGLLSPDSRHFPGGKLTGIVGLVSEVLACDSEDWTVFLGSAFMTLGHLESDPEASEVGCMTFLCVRLVLYEHFLLFVLLHFLISSTVAFLYLSPLILNVKP